MMFLVTSTVTHFRFKNHQKLCLRGMPRHYFTVDTSHYRAATSDFYAATSENGGSTWSATSPLAVMTSSPMWHCPEKTPPTCRRRGLHVAHFSAPEITPRRACYGDVSVFLRMSAFVFTASSMFSCLHDILSNVYAFLET